jgi:hypothetical protein
MDDDFLCCMIPPSMNVFIRNNQTKEFFCGGDEWASTLDRAMNCRTALSAESIVRRRQFSDVSVVLTFDDGRETIVLTLSNFISESC